MKDFKKEKGLNEKELIVLKKIAEGKSNLDIAEEMFLSEHTIKVYVRNILDKMKVDSRIQAAVKAIKASII